MIADGYSVEAACREYVEDRRSEKNEACAHDAHKRFERTVPLPSAAVALFDRLAQGKRPGDLLFTRDDGKPWAHSDWDGLVRAEGGRAGGSASRVPMVEMIE